MNGTSDDSQVDKKDALELQEKTQETLPVAGLPVDEVLSSERGDLVSAPQYRVYKRRWLGLILIFLVNVLNAANCMWFTAVASEAALFLQVSASSVSWLANVTNLSFCAVSLLVPALGTRFSLRTTTVCSAGLLILSGWVRYAGAQAAGGNRKGWAVMLLASLVAGAAQPLTLCIGTKYSERWHPIQERASATMLLTLGLPVGIAVAQVVTPILITSPQRVPFSTLVLACVNLVSLLAICIPSAPPIPPTYSSSLVAPTLKDTLRLFWSFDGPPPAVGEDVRLPMTPRERRDFYVLLVLFSSLVGVFSAFTVQVNGFFVPHGYSISATGNMSAGLIVAGLLGAIVSAVIFDRVLTNHLALAAKILIPLSAGAYLSLVWVIKPDNVVAIVAVLILLGLSLFSLLAVGLELSTEVTRQPEASSAALFFFANLFAFVCITVMDALRSGPDASPPFNMRKSIIFSASFMCLSGALCFALEGKQSRTELDRERRGARSRGEPSLSA